MTFRIGWKYFDTQNQQDPPLNISVVRQNFVNQAVNSSYVYLLDEEYRVPQDSIVIGRECNTYTHRLLFFANFSVPFLFFSSILYLLFLVFSCVAFLIVCFFCISFTLFSFLCCFFLIFVFTLSILVSILLQTNIASPVSFTMLCEIVFPSIFLFSCPSPPLSHHQCLIKHLPPQSWLTSATTISHSAPITVTLWRRFFASRAPVQTTSTSSTQPPASNLVSACVAFACVCLTDPLCLPPVSAAKVSQLHQDKG